MMDRNNRNAFIGILITIGIVLLEGWIGDGIKGDELFPWWSGGPLKFGQPHFVIVLAGMLVLALAGAACLGKLLGKFQQIQVQRISEPNEVQPRPSLVLTISWPNNWEWTATQLESSTDKLKLLSLPSGLDGALTTMAALDSRAKFPWEQMLRAIQPHAGKIERLTLLSSSGKDGTKCHFDRCRRMIRHYFPSIREDAIACREVHFDSLEELLKIYREIAELDRGRGLMIDVTGGTKVTSIAAAMVTLEHPAIEFQYVETAGEKHVRSFNVTSVSPPTAL